MADVVEFSCQDEFTFVNKSYRTCSLRLADRALYISHEDNNSDSYVMLDDIIGCKIAPQPSFSLTPKVWQTKLDIDTTQGFLHIYSYPLIKKNLTGIRRCRRVLVFGCKNGDNVTKLEEWRQAILDKVRKLCHSRDDEQIGYRRKLLILINPVSGQGKAKYLFDNFVVHMINEAEIPYDVLLTEKRFHAYEIAKSLNKTDWHGILTVSGDGLLNEVINGLMDRDDRIDAITLPVGTIAGGSGNGLACSLNYYAGEPYMVNLVLHSTFTFIKHRAVPMDLVWLETPTQSACSFLSLTFGMFADIDYESEYLRRLGNTRFALIALKLIMAHRKYPYRISFLPMIEYEAIAEPLKKSVPKKIRSFSFIAKPGTKVIRQNALDKESVSTEDRGDSKLDGVYVDEKKEELNDINDVDATTAVEVDRRSERENSVLGGGEYRDRGDGNDGNGRDEVQRRWSNCDETVGEASDKEIGDILGCVENSFGLAMGDYSARVARGVDDSKVAAECDQTEADVANLENSECEMDSTGDDSMNHAKKNFPDSLHDRIIYAKKNSPNSPDDNILIHAKKNCSDSPDDDDDIIIHPNKNCPDSPNDDDIIIHVKNHCPDFPDDDITIHAKKNCPDSPDDDDIIIHAKKNCPDSPDDDDIIIHAKKNCPDSPDDDDIIIHAKKNCPDSPDVDKIIHATKNCPDSPDDDSLIQTRNTYPDFQNNNSIITEKNDPPEEKSTLHSESSENSLDTESIIREDITAEYDATDAVSSLLVPLDKPVPKTWRVIEGEFAGVILAHQCLLGPELLVAPECRLNSGFIQLFIPKTGMSRMRMLKLMGLLKCGAHIDEPDVTMAKVLAFRVEPLSDEGVIMVDGEPFSLTPIQGQVLPGMSRVMTLSPQ